MITKFKLFENPDTLIYDDGLKANAFSSDSRAFGYAEIVLVGNQPKFFEKLNDRDKELYKDKKCIGMLVSKYNRTTHWDMFIRGTNPMNNSLERQKYIYPGRLWEQKKLMSFWSYPKPEEFEQVIKDIELASGLKIWDDEEWRVEVIYGRNKKIYDPNDFRWGAPDDPALGYHDTALIKLQNYKGSTDFETKVNLDISPLDKEKNLTYLKLTN